MTTFFDRRTKVVQLDDENSVTIRALTWGELTDARSAATKAELDMAGGRQSLTVDPFKMRHEILVRGIQSWDGPGFGGRPVTPENIAALPGHIADLLADEIDRLNDVSEDEKK